MSGRNIFKTIVPLVAFAFIVAIVVGGIALALRWSREPVKTRKEVIADSVDHYKAQEQIHGDSAKFYHEKYENYTSKSDSIDGLDSSDRARSRADYRAEWERKNGY